jgi:hypothetical protein
MMALENRLVEKVKAYCEKNRIEPLAGSVRYVGLNPSVEMLDGTRVPRYIVGFSTGETYMIARNYIHIDPDSEKLLMLITAHFSESINEDS